MVNCKLNKLILVSKCYYYYMQEVFSFKKRHTSQLYYDGLLYLIWVGVGLGAHLNLFSTAFALK